MRQRRIASQLGILSTTVALAGLVGCQTPTPSAPSAGEGSVKAGTNAKTPTAGGGAAVGNPDDPAMIKNAVGDGDALSKQPAVHISAKDGGVYVSPDGLLEARIPPGVLSKDADVRFMRVETASLANSEVHLNGIRFQMDLGGAIIAPNSKVTIKSKADERLVGELKSMYPDFTPERYSLEKDAKGNWAVVMSVNGPVDTLPEDAPDSGAEGPTRGKMSEGQIPLAAAPGGKFNKDSRIEAFCNYAPPPAPATYGAVHCLVQWDSDDPNLNRKPAQGSAGVSFGQAGWAARVEVDWSADLVTGARASQFSFTPSLRRPPLPPICVDEYGNILPPWSVSGGVLQPPNLATQQDRNDLAAWIAQYPGGWTQLQNSGQLAFNANRGKYSTGSLPFGGSTGVPQYNSRIHPALDASPLPSVNEHFLGATDVVIAAGSLLNFQPLQPTHGSPISIQLFPAVQGVAAGSGADIINNQVDFDNNTPVALFSAGAHACGGGDCNGPYVNVNNNAPVIEPIGFNPGDQSGAGNGVGSRVFTGPSATNPNFAQATISALQGGNLQRCSSGGCTGSTDQRFYVYSQPLIYDRLDSTTGDPQDGFYDTVADATGNLPQPNQPAYQETRLGPVPKYRLQKYSPEIIIGLTNSTDILAGFGVQGGRLIIEGTITDTIRGTKTPLHVGAPTTSGMVTKVMQWDPTGNPPTPFVAPLAPTNKGLAASIQPVGPGTGTALGIFITLPDDNVYSVSIDKVYTESLDLFAKPQDLQAVQNLQIQRNNQYNRNIQLVLNQAK